MNFGSARRFDERVEILSADELIVLSNVFNAKPVGEKLGDAAAKLEKEGLLAKIPKSRGHRWILDGDARKAELASTPQDDNLALDVQRAAILEYCTTPRSRVEIQEHIGLKDRKHFRLEILNPLIDAGLLALTIPDKPKSPKQKYVIQKTSFLI